jgi:hypothetical protein
MICHLYLSNLDDQNQYDPGFTGSMAPSRARISPLTNYHQNASVLARLSFMKLVNIPLYSQLSWQGSSPSADSPAYSCPSLPPQTVQPLATPFHSTTPLILITEREPTSATFVLMNLAKSHSALSLTSQTSYSGSSSNAPTRPY